MIGGASSPPVCALEPSWASLRGGLQDATRGGGEGTLRLGLGLPVGAFGRPTPLRTGLAGLASALVGGRTLRHLQPRLHTGHQALLAALQLPRPRVPAPRRSARPLRHRPPPLGPIAPPFPPSAAPPPCAPARRSTPDACACSRTPALAPDSVPNPTSPRSRANHTPSTDSRPKSSRCRRRNSQIAWGWGKFSAASTRTATSSSSLPRNGARRPPWRSRRAPHLYPHRRLIGGVATTIALVGHLTCARGERSDHSLR